MFLNLIFNRADKGTHPSILYDDCNVFYQNAVVKVLTLLPGNNLVFSSENLKLQSERYTHKLLKTKLLYLFSSARS
ncbi:hypothetical protein DBR40_09370 [Pedobacter sp. KBW01]|nr:hypothetical protein DBR40_09370 [Pedobacter sp. KBW01]